MESYPILRGIGIGIATFVLVGFRLGLFRYLWEKLTDYLARPED